MSHLQFPRRDRTPLIYTVFFLIPLCSYLFGARLHLPAVAIALVLPQIAAAAWMMAWPGAILASLTSILGWYSMALLGRMPFGEVDTISVTVGTAIALAFGGLVNRLQTTIEMAHTAAGTDSLTGLLNRSGFCDQISHELNRGKRQGSGLAIAFIDCDNFKLFNDSHGHLDGDELLIATGRRLRQSLRSYDSVARMGGDEFALLLPEITPEHSDIVARRVHDQLRAMARDAGWQVTFSMGMVVFPYPRSVDEMLRKADEAMYDVKHTGKDNFQFRVDNSPSAIPENSPSHPT
ncbi:MAG: GGDEF domain-containing protein [Planctomycetota bacterium]|nr:MAG: GGDEF domain-containing protein [Planctomycetota bacterium]